jgi:TatA/E family protein of Tat protein translocase
MRLLENPLVWIMLLAVALIIFGPSRLPELGASLGRAIREFRKSTTELTDNLKEEIAKPADPARATGAPPAATASDTPVTPVPPAETPKA